MHQKSRLSPLAGATLTLGLLALLPGCGGGGSNGSSSGSSSNNGSNNGGGSQAANYAEAVTLADGQTGALTLTTSGSSATGSLAVAAASSSVRSRAASPHTTATVPAGVYAVTGTFANGTFTLTGTISGTAFTLTVTPPGGSTAGTFSLATGGTTYAGTLAAAPTGAGADSAIAGSYQIISITNPATSQTVTCPGTLPFGPTDNDSCGTAEIFTLNTDGTYSITINGTTAGTGTYTLVGNILTNTGKELEASGNGQIVTAVASIAISGATLTSTLLSTTAADAQPQIGEVMTYTNTGSGTGGTLSSLAGSYKATSITDPGIPTFACPGSVNTSGDTDSCTADDVLTLTANGTLTFTSAGVIRETGTYSVNGTTVTLNRTDAGSSTSYVETYSFTFNGSQLTTTRLTSANPNNTPGAVETYTKQ